MGSIDLTDGDAMLSVYQGFMAFIIHCLGQLFLPFFMVFFFFFFSSIVVFNCSAPCMAIMGLLCTLHLVLLKQ
jgi:hypothetical protein